MSEDQKSTEETEKAVVPTGSSASSEAKPQAQSIQSSSDDRPWGMDLNVFCTLMHLSQFCNFIFPFGGLILPIVMWAQHKDKNPEVDVHGRAIFNWMASSFIFFFGSFILVFLIIGIPLLMAVAVCNLVFIILAAVKANENTYWKYPLSFDFFGYEKALDSVLK